MIHEYALDPELVATWTDRPTGRYFIDKFGLGTTRVASNYPRKHWKRLVWDEWEHLAPHENGGPSRDSAKKRLEVLLEQLRSHVVARRGRHWDSSRSWLDNVVDEHRECPFHAILAKRDTPHESKYPVLLADEIDALGNESVLWSSPTGTTAPQSANGIADAIRSMLRIATRIVFVDPYFSPANGKRVKAIAACVRAALKQRPVGRPIMDIIAADKHATEKSCVFSGDCEKKLPKHFPIEQEITIRRYKELDSGEKLHNRYVLTNLGGVHMGYGAVEGKEGQSDDINILDRRQYEKRWRQYIGEPMEAFSQPDPEICIVGQCSD